jgi:hypothetical protein
MGLQVYAISRIFGGKMEEILCRDVCTTDTITQFVGLYRAEESCVEVGIRGL